MEWIQSKVESLCAKYGTRNPFELAEFLRIYVTPWDLHQDINGFYQYEKRNQIIFINSNLSYEEQIIVCAHELGHAVLHKLSSVPFMRAHTLFSVDKIEIEANTFAAHLLISDESLLGCKREQTTINNIASLHNVPVELVTLKCKGLF